MADSAKEKPQRQVFERHNLFPNRQVTAYVNCAMTDSTVRK